MGKLVHPWAVLDLLVSGEEYILGGHFGGGAFDVSMSGVEAAREDEPSRAFHGPIIPSRSRFDGFV